MKNIKSLMVLALCGSLTLPLVACSSDDASEQTAGTPAVQEESAQHTPEKAPAVGSMQLANPFETFQSLEEAEKAAGFTMPLPASLPDGYSADAYRVLMTGEKMIEVILRNANREIRFRKGGPDNNSGVHEQYPENSQEDLDGIAVTFGGKDALVHVAYWKADGFAHSISATTFKDTEGEEVVSGLPREQMLLLVKGMVSQ